MKFNFKIQQYQTDAVEAVANVFAGQGFHDRIAYRRDVGDNQPKTYQMTFGTDEELDPMSETGIAECQQHKNVFKSCKGLGTLQS